MTLSPMQSLKTATHSLASLQSRAWLPPALLLLALSSVFLFGGDLRGYFYRGGAHDQTSAKNMAIVENLSPEHHFLMFIGLTLNADGKPTYIPYNRFPIGSYALIKLTTSPFGDNLLAKIYAARMLMLLFFSTAAVLAYLSLRRIASSRWVALTATLLAFSSACCLYYIDLISSEAMVDLFALMLVFHAIVIFEQEGRFLQLPTKACIALILGWHVYALLLPFIVFGLLREFIKTHSSHASTSGALSQLRHTALSLARSRYMTLGVVALLFGVSILTFNFTNEYFALNREVPFTETPSFNSMMNRTGVAPYTHEELISDWSWGAFLERQFYRIGIMSLPYAFSPSYVMERMSTYNFVDHADSPQPLFVILGIVVSGASLIGLLFVRRHKILLSTLALSGFCWALPMRYTTAFPNHNFEAIFYIGVTLTLFSFILLGLLRLQGERLIAALSIVALLVFAISALRMAQPINDAETFEIHKAILADLKSIRDMTEGEEKAIWAKMIGSKAFYLAESYLVGRVVIFARDKTAQYARPSDLIIAPMRIDGLTSLTPRNQTLFLYEWDDYRRYIDEIIEQAGVPLIRSDFDVYLNDNALIYVKDNCRMSETRPRFFLALYPADENDLPDERRQHGFHNLDFHFGEHAFHLGKRCIAATPLPEYDIASIYTGQYIQRADGSTEHLWEGEFRPAEVTR